MTELRHRLPAHLRRRQLLDVALERFAANGYSGTSMEEIADAAGVTKPVLYQHFDSKRTLYLELLRTVGADLQQELTKRVSAQSQPYHQVLEGFRAYFEFVGTRTSAFQLLYGSGAREDDEFATAVQDLEDESAQTIAPFIEADIDDDHRELLAYAIVGLAEVTARAWVTRSGPTVDPDQAEVLAVRLADLVFAGLRGLPGGSDRVSGA